MDSLRSLAVVALAVLAVSTTPPAQTHARDELVRGQPAQLHFQGLPTISFGVVAFSLSGTGQGPCAPALGICLNVLDPIVFSGAIPSNFLGNATFDLRVAPGTQPFQVGTQGLWLDLTTSPVGFVTTNAADGFIETLAAWNQTFDANLIDPEWQIDWPAQFTRQFSSGKLVLTPNGSGPDFAWHDDSVGGRIYRDVYDDFRVSTHLRAFDPSAPTEVPPPAPRKLGGLLLRTPASMPGARDWIAIAFGSGSLASPHAITAISTVGVTSTFTEISPPTAPDPTSAELQLERIGDTIHCRFRHVDTAPFSNLATFTRPGLPLRLEIGMFVSSADGTPDVSVAFDDLRFEN